MVWLDSGNYTARKMKIPQLFFVAAISLVGLTGITPSAQGNPMLPGYYQNDNPMLDGYIQDDNPMLDGYVQDKSVFGL